MKGYTMTTEQKLDNLTDNGLIDRMLSGYDRFIRIKNIYYTLNSGHTWRRWLND